MNLPAIQQALQIQTGTVAYSTFLGGSFWDRGTGIAVDQQGYIYLVGSTASADFPTTPGAAMDRLQGVDAFVVKLSPTGEELIFATYLGGSGQDSAFDVAIDAGVVYLTGETWSDDFPLTGGLHGENDVFVAALDASTGELLSASLFGGDDQDVGYGIAVEDGEVYVTGSTFSSEFEGVDNAGSMDAFVLKLTGSGALDYVILLGGRNEDAGFDLVVEGGEAYITGQTWSPNFPADGYQGEDDAFVVKLDRGGEPAFSILLGGREQDSANALVLHEGVLVVGDTQSADFPVTTGTYAGDGDAFVAWIDPDGNTLFSTYLGGTATDEGTGVGLDRSGQIYVCGNTNSDDLPIGQDAVQSSSAGNKDAFLMRLVGSSNLEYRLDYATYLGGSALDRCQDAAVVGAGQVYLTGTTASLDFPTTLNAYSQELGGPQDAFLSIFVIPTEAEAPTTSAPPDVTGTPAEGDQPTSPQTGTAENQTPAPGATQPAPGTTTAPGVPTSPEPGVAVTTIESEPGTAEAATSQAGAVSTPSTAETPGTGVISAQETSDQPETAPAADDQVPVNPLLVIGILIAVGLILLVIWYIFLRQSRPDDASQGDEGEQKP